MAIDAQGPEKARPFVERAYASFTTVVDEGNLLARLYGFKAIPNGLFVDEAGILRFKKYGGFDIRKAETAQAVEEWSRGSFAGQRAPETTVHPVPSVHEKAQARFSKGLRLYKAGRVQEALVEWRTGVSLEPDNYVIRKQIWAVEHPERFYDGEVDYDWQKEQLEEGR